jgi:hypothetical protein
LQKGRIAALDAMVASLVATIASDDPDPFVVRLLLARYRATGDEALFDALGGALARGIDRSASDREADERAAWLVTLAAAAAISDDEAVGAAIRALLEPLSSMPEPFCIEASLCGAAAVHDVERLTSIVDNLERTIARTYEPGEVMRDPIATASALLTAHDLTGRLPYSMLAEELMQTVRARAGGPAGVRDALQAADVLCRLAALHQDEEYRAAAVVAPGADYRADAERLIARYENDRLPSHRDAAMLGLAVARWLDLQ